MRVLPSMATVDIDLAEKLLQLAYQDDGSPAPDSSFLDYGLAGAVLVELVIAGRVAPVDGRLRLVNPRPTGDPVVDRGLAEIAKARTEASAQEWVGWLSAGLRGAVLDRLTERGLLRRQDQRVLWVFPTSRYPSATYGQPAPEIDARRRLALAGARPPDPRTHVLWSLVRSTGLVASAFPGHPEDEVGRRLDALDQPDQAVRWILTELEAAINAVVMAATGIVPMGGG